MAPKEFYVASFPIFRSHRLLWGTAVVAHLDEIARTANTHVYRVEVSAANHAVGTVVRWLAEGRPSAMMVEEVFGP